jgi:hypothetical protein
MKSKLILLLLAVAGTALAKENIGSRSKAPSARMKSITAGCAASTAKTELAFNNVRTVICINGDMWWDPMAQQGPQYEIPKGSGKNSLFSGALWMGGVDASNNLKVAAQTYRQGGSDFWPGPVDTTSAGIDPEVCLQYDRHWKLTLQELIDFKAYSEVVNPPAGYTDASIPEAIKTWPGTGDMLVGHQTQYLAPYVDVDSDGVYNYQAGDYPDHNQLYTTVKCGNYLYGDQFIWWVFNDVGNIHTETGGAPLGLEIQAQAFAFATNDEVNNMTFYNYRIINRSSTQVNNNYFGVFVDADLGFFKDDYVGCDVPRGLGYCYNGDADDEGPSGYGVNPPAVGIDFFQGPLANDSDGVDNNRNCIVDEPGEQIIMSRFIYFNNQNSPPNGNPFTASDYYNYLRGKWKNGADMTYGGDGIGGGVGSTSIPCLFMFPGNTDHEWEWGTGGDCFSNSPGAPRADWDEVTAGNLPDDRRFLHTAGPFVLQPGALNTITTGAVWARATQGGPLASVNILRIVDDKAQALFDACFSILNGPDAPDVTIRELDKEVILTISNSPSSNNVGEGYKETDPYIRLSPTDTLYRFQGYQIFQLKDETVSSSELHNPDKVRLVAQIDIKDSISQVVNHNFDFSNSTWVSVTEVNGENKGIKHSFRILKDLFASGDNRLINHKNYFYMAIAYGFNYTEVSIDPYNLQDGHNQPYIAGRRNVKVYTAIPHIPSPENYGQQLNSIYGNGPRLTRIEGNGDGYLINYNTPDINSSDISSIRLTLDITPETMAEILDVNTGYRSLHPEYEAGRGPVNIKVIDPVKVPKASFVLWLENINDTAKWYLHNLNTDETITADAKYSTLTEQLFPQWGLSATLSKIVGPLLLHDGTEEGHGFVEATMEFSDPNKFWLIGVPDGDGTADIIDSAFNWVHPPDTNIVHGIDPQNKYGKVLGGIWAPYRLVTNSPQWPHGAGYQTSVITQNLGQNLNSIDVVITRDKSKWSRCVVLESDNSPVLAQGGASKSFPRRSFSVNKEGVYATDSVATSTDPNSPNYISGSGMSWFPGYAIDIEKGERLNIMFAEDSWLAGENGKDMKWNPSSHFIGDFGEIQMGGKHFVYIVNSNYDDAVYNQMPGYDACATIRGLFTTLPAIDKTRIFKNITWVNFPITVEGYNFENGMVPPCDVKVRLRVARPYSSYGTGTPVDSVSLQPNTTYVVFNGKIKYDGINYSTGQTFTTNTITNYSVITLGSGSLTAVVLTSNGNNGFPMYTFKTDGLADQPYNVDVAKSALDLINVVPNPYYAYSGYEGTLVAGVSVQPQLDNRVKIVNLPPKCTISIYTVNGILVRRFNRDVASDNSNGAEVTDKNFETSQDWDLKNHKNVPIASGLYLIHVEAKDASGSVIGERTLKWFGVMRPIDLDSF